MAEKKAKTAEKSGATQVRHLCPDCGVDSRVTYVTGFGRKGFFWICEQNCGYMVRAR